MMSIVEKVVHGCLGPGSITSDVPSATASGTPLPTRRLWELACAAGAHLESRVGTPAVAVNLDSSIEAVATLVGGWISGLRVVSLPTPPRSADDKSVAADIDAMCTVAGCDLFVADDRLAKRIADLTATNIVSFATVAQPTNAVAASIRHGGSYVQFSSGSTGSPKGIDLALDAMARNVDSLIDSFGHERPVLSSWLPLSHDMGLMTTLTTLAAMADSGGEIHLMSPERFASRPSRWIASLSDQRATVTAAPTTGYRLAALRTPRVADLDLSNLRVALVGAEPVSANVLRDFDAAYAAAGLKPTALSPAYGLAEATVGVTCSRPNERWTSTVVDSTEISHGRWTPTADGTEIVSCGRAMTGVEVRTQPVTGVGTVLVRSGAVAAGYLEGRLPVEHGWLRTSDSGHVSATGELHIVGRNDDVVVVAGRKLHPEQIEARLMEEELVRGSDCAVLSAPGGYSVAVSPPRSARQDMDSYSRAVRLACVRATGVSPQAVLALPSRAFPRTSSGKIQRGKLHNALVSGCIDDVERHGFGTGAPV